MTPFPVVSLLYFYGIFLVVCGIVSVTFIGMKAKTALISGGTSGISVLGIGYLIAINTPGAVMAGVVMLAEKQKK